MEDIFNLRPLQVGDVEYVGQTKKKNNLAPHRRHREHERLWLFKTSSKC